MLGNILAVGLMSMGMGLSGVKDEPQKRANAQTPIQLADVTKENAKAFFENYMDLTEAANDQTYTFNTNEIIGEKDWGGTLGTLESIDFRILHSNPHTNSSNSIALQGNRQNETTWTDYLRYNIDVDTMSVNSGTLTTYPEEVGSLLTTGELPQQPMGQSIISSIASGLGIIGALATTFLTGFGNLFYSSGALTPFAIFSLVMLGVAVSFAVVKLVLNLIRSNTGA